MSSLKDLNDRHGVLFRRGDRVLCDERWGTVVGATYSHIRVRFDGRKISSPCEPCELRQVTEVLMTPAPIMETHVPLRRDDARPDLWSVFNPTQKQLTQDKSRSRMANECIHRPRSIPGVDQSVKNDWRNQPEMSTMI